MRKQVIQQQLEIPYNLYEVQFLQIIPKIRAHRADQALWTILRSKIRAVGNTK